MQTTHTKQPRVIVGMSGGVDSSVAALLLLRHNFSVGGLFMKNWEEDDTDRYCAAATDLTDAQAVCDQLGIPLHTVNFSTEYWERVFTHFLAEYRAGRTPNPDILCNQEIKFKAFLEHAMNLGADYIATGHYARITRGDTQFRLLKGWDPVKDQSYFLYTLGQSQLSHILLPLGEMTKQEVRQQAAKAGFDNYAKKDSTGICFIGERRFKPFLSRYLPTQPGEMRSPNGERLGRHDGLMYYTLGQRRGLGLGGQCGGNGQPWYVVGKDLANNVLFVAQGEHPMLYHRHLRASALHWIAGRLPTVPLICHAKIRYRQHEQACTITRLDRSCCTVEFTQPQRAVTPGQSVVFYQGEECLGGGVIDAVGAP